MKTVKIMSDGNQAKVGMIIYDVYTKSIGVITYIKDQNLRLKTKSNGIWSTRVWDAIIFYKPIVNKSNCNLTNETGFDCALLSSVSKATPEQKKLYWLELEKQTIKFIPKFETKLKELGIRDKFINNLFDSKCQTKHFNKKRGLKETRWDLFILRSFDWHLTQEQEGFWRNIYGK